VGRWSDAHGRKPFMLLAMVFNALPACVLVLYLYFGTSLLWCGTFYNQSLVVLPQHKEPWIHVSETMAVPDRVVDVQVLPRSGAGRWGVHDFSVFGVCGRPPAAVSPVRCCANPSCTDTDHTKQ